MPQRFLRPGIRNSSRWNAVDWPEQSFYLRILTLVDDFGRYDGRPSVLWGECFSVWNEQHPDKAIGLHEVGQMLQRLAADSVQLLDLYESEGKKVLQVTQWQERIREGAKEKWPKNPNPQQSAAKRSVPLPPSSPPSSPPVAIAIAHSPSSPPVAARRCATPPPSPQSAGQAERQKRERVNLEEILPDKKVELNGRHLDLISAVNSIYRRPTEDPWSYEEQCLACEVSKRPHWKAEASEISKYKDSLREKKWFPQSVRRLLSGWTETLDKARFAARHPSARGYSTK